MNTRTILNDKHVKILRLEKERRGSFEIYRTVPKVLVVSSKNNLASCQNCSLQLHDSMNKTLV